jgi:hypothetical protein
MAIINHSSGGNPMYTIDLLKGEGIPIPCRPGGIAMACLIVVLPLLLGLGMTSYYMDGQVIVSIEKQQLSKLEAAANNMSAALKKKEQLEQHKALALGRLSDIKASMKGYTQWSPALAAVVGNLSDTLVLTRLEAKQDSVRRKVPSKDDPATKVDVSVPVRTLKLSVAGRGDFPGRRAESPGEPAVVAGDRTDAGYDHRLPEHRGPGRPGGRSVRA